MPISMPITAHELCLPVQNPRTGRRYGRIQQAVDAAENGDEIVLSEGVYHLRSAGGRWDAAVEQWIDDAVTSPCVDAGDPLDPVGEEPAPNGGRANIGAYAGTIEASRSP
jgi:hypothetical protein